MSFLLAHIHTLINQYKFSQPLPLYLKQYFSQNKKLGSRDRKAIQEAVFNYFLYKPFAPDADVLDLLLSIKKAGVLKQPYLLSVLEKACLDVDENNLPTLFKDLEDFPLLSAPLEKSKYFEALQKSSLLFIRLKANAAKLLIALEEKFKIYFKEKIKETQDWIIGLENGVDLHSVLPANAFVVQDYASQAVLIEAFEYIQDKSQITQIWDACCGAGGKTLLTKSFFPKAKIWATDIRPQILRNLQERRKTQGWQGIQTEVLNLELPLTQASSAVQNIISNTNFDLAIADVPCSGSGTWSRSPEQFAHYKLLDLDKIQKRQIAIAQNVIATLPSSAYFIYCTCSVFQIENEAVCEHLINAGNIELIHQECVDASTQGGDILFFALFRKQ